MSEDRRSPTRTPRISTVHTLLSLARWTQSATDIPVHCLISSVQRLRGLPRRLFPAMVPCRICVHRLSARTTWPKYCSLERAWPKDVSQTLARPYRPIPTNHSGFLALRVYMRWCDIIHAFKVVRLWWQTHICVQKISWRMHGSRPGCWTLFCRLGLMERW